ncbi:MAG: ribosome maturation factor RimM [Kineosporiaceae bacterium]
MTSADRRRPAGPEPVRLVAGRVVRGHGLRGEAVVDVRSDQADRRFAPGAVLDTVPDVGRLTVTGVRRHHDRLLVRFAGVADRDAADALRGTDLLVDVTAELTGADPTAEPTGADLTAEAGAWFVLELVGCVVTDTAGSPLGRVSGVVSAPGHDLLVVAYEGRDVLVPFVGALVPVVDVAARRVVVDPPGGLFDP